MFIIDFNKIEIQNIKNKLYKRFEIINLDSYIYYLNTVRAVRNTFSP